MTVDFSHMCPHYERASELLGKRWTGLIVRVLMCGPTRFRDLKNRIPDMNDRILSDRLKELEACGIITRTVYPEIPARVEYRLTQKGQDLQPVIEAIQRWAERWVPVSTRD